MKRYLPYWLPVLLFWFVAVLGLLDAGGMFLWLFGYYLVFPLTSFFGALYARWRGPPWSWAFPVVFGISSLLVPVLASGNLLLPQSLLFGFVPSALGWGIGYLLRRNQKE